jgi:hypothetical protein
MYNNKNNINNENIIDYDNPFNVEEGFEEEEEESLATMTYYDNPMLKTPIPKNPQNPVYKKPKVTYEDILTSLNLKVNNGKLEVIPPSQKNNASSQPIYNNITKKITQTIPQQNPNQQNSYIYNKYFKDYRDPQDQRSQEPIYITPQEYRRRVLLELVRRKYERKRISEIKSKKLLFAQNNPNAPTTQIQAYGSNNDGLNKLFMFSR